MMLEMRRALEEGLPALELALPQDRIDCLCAYAEGLLRQNTVMNLTAITEPVQVARLHLLDSLTLLKAAELSGKRLIDVGCGAGLPGVPVKIACPQIELTLLDSLGKRMAWLERFLPELGVQARCVTARAEEAVAQCRETYDAAASRAVARLNILLELTAPYVRLGGQVLAMKGAAAREELAQAGNAVRKLGLELESVKEFTIDGASRSVIVLRKVRPTSPQYPRRYAKIKQSPL